MKVTIQTGGKSAVTLRFPLGAAVHFLRKTANKHNVQLSRKQTKALLRAVKAYRKANPGWLLAEIQSHSGEQIHVSL